MKAKKSLGFPLLAILFVLITIPFQSCEPDEKCDKCSIAYKPNIYIYPEEEIQLSVSLSFPMGGEVISSIPDYGLAWNISVDTSGLIDNTYSYLFYESTQPDIWQRTHGWIINKTELESFFRENMAAYGFNNQEIDDYIDYWIPRLDEYTYYSIYPQTARLINDVIVLHFSLQPDNILRLFYVVHGNMQMPDTLIEPKIEQFKREGYFATEWGVIL